VLFSLNNLFRGRGTPYFMESLRLLSPQELIKLSVILQMPRVLTKAGFELFKNCSGYLKIYFEMISGNVA